MAYRIVVDAGHGGDDPGAVYGGLQEKNFNLEAANYMYRRFQDLGLPVAITRTDDTTLTREERLNTMRSLGTDSQVIILSNHMNSGGGEGAEIVYPLRSTDTLARNILEAIGEEGQITRKYYQRRLPEDPSKDYYYIMRETPNTTALLIEYGFIDNANDRRKLEEKQTDYAEAVVRAVANYTGTTYIPPGGTAQNTYTVRAGDTLYSIAQRFGLTVDELRRLNNLTSNNLSIGQVLIISQGDIEEPPTSTTTYTVQSGDTLYKIARQFNTTVGDLISLNNLTSTSLSIGQVLRIPTNEQEPEEPEQDFITYTVKSGDSLWKISQEYGVSVDAIINANNLTSTSLQIGDVLIIPVTSTEEPTLPPTSNYIEYTVKSGDSLWLIANRYNTTVDAIKTASGITSNTLQIGQVLRIPTSNSYTTYTVKSGDNLYNIARQFNTTVNEIRNLNGLTSNVLSIGQVLRIPIF